ncbi:hypothetical protein P7C73_g3841, partial [Tremellales sp. Uapishka_1]
MTTYEAAGEDFDDVEQTRLLDLTEEEPCSVDIDRWALCCLLLQHASSMFNTGAYDFASFLFCRIMLRFPRLLLTANRSVIEIYRDTLIPASLVGFFTTATGLVLSGYMGSWVDRSNRLPFVRKAMTFQKAFHAINYGLFLVMFGPLRDVAQAAFHGDGPLKWVLATWTILIATIGISSLLGLASTGLTVAVERDWGLASTHATKHVHATDRSPLETLFSAFCVASYYTWGIYISNRGPFRHGPVHLPDRMVVDSSGLSAIPGSAFAEGVHPASSARLDNFF